jgi:hypothetical protein
MGRVDGDASELEAWIEATGRLDKPTRFGIVGVLQEFPLVRLVAAGYDPRLRLDPTIASARTALLACHPSEGVSRLDATFRISPTGTVRAVSAAPSDVAEGVDGAALASCVEKAVEELAFPCTPSKREEEVEAQLCVGR